MDAGNGRLELAMPTTTKTRWQKRSKQLSTTILFGVGNGSVDPEKRMPVLTVGVLAGASYMTVPVVVPQHRSAGPAELDR